MQVDIGIITIIDEEFSALLRRFGSGKTLSVGHRLYRIFNVSAIDGSIYRLAVARCQGQGNSHAQSLATAMLSDVKPMFILLVGIGGGVPSADYTLGDVIISTHIYDFSIGAVHQGRDLDYSQRGGAVATDAVKIAMFLRAEEERLGPWNTDESVGMQRPPVKLSDPAMFYGPPDWVSKVRRSLRGALGTPRGARQPIFKDGPIESSNLLVKDADTLAQWMTSSRDALAIDMESAGVYSAMQFADNPIPFFSIRGLSDIVGYVRDDRWKKYACNSAAAFTLALIRSGSLPRRDPVALPVTVAADPTSLEATSMLPDKCAGDVADPANCEPANLADEVLKVLARLAEPRDGLAFKKPPWSFWCYGGYLAYGHPWAGLLDTLPIAARRDFYIGTGMAAFAKADYTTAAKMALLGLDLSHETNQPWLLSFSQFALGASNAYLDASDIVSHLVGGAKVAVNQQDAWLVAFGNVCVGSYLWSKQLHEAAATHFEYAMRIYVKCNDSLFVSIAANSLAHLVRRGGDNPTAACIYLDVIRRSERIGYERAMAGCVLGTAGVCASSGHALKAAMFWGAAVTQLERLRSTVIPPIASDYSRTMAVIREQLGDDEFAIRYDAGKRLQLKDAVNLAVKYLDPLCSVSDCRYRGITW